MAAEGLHPKRGRGGRGRSLLDRAAAGPRRSAGELRGAFGGGLFLAQHLAYRFLEVARELVPVARFRLMNSLFKL